MTLLPACSDNDGVNFYEGPPTTPPETPTVSVNVQPIPTAKRLIIESIEITEDGQENVPEGAQYLHVGTVTNASVSDVSSGKLSIVAPWSEHDLASARKAASADFTAVEDFDALVLPASDGRVLYMGATHYGEALLADIAFEIVEQSKLSSVKSDGTVSSSAVIQYGEYVELDTLHVIGTQSQGAAIPLQNRDMLLDPQGLAPWLTYNDVSDGVYFIARRDNDVPTLSYRSMDGQEIHFDQLTGNMRIVGTSTSGQVYLYNLDDAVLSTVDVRRDELVQTICESCFVSANVDRGILTVRQAGRLSILDIDTEQEVVVHQSNNTKMSQAELMFGPVARIAGESGAVSFLNVRTDKKYASQQLGIYSPDFGVRMDFMQAKKYLQPGSLLTGAAGTMHYLEVLARHGEHYIVLGGSAMCGMRESCPIDSYHVFVVNRGGEVVREVAILDGAFVDALYESRSGHLSIIQRHEAMGLIGKYSLDVFDLDSGHRWSMPGYDNIVSAAGDSLLTLSKFHQGHSEVSMVSADTIALLTPEMRLAAQSVASVPGFVRTVDVLNADDVAVRDAAIVDDVSASIVFEGSDEDDGAVDNSEMLSDEDVTDEDGGELAPDDAAVDEVDPGVADVEGPGPDESMNEGDSDSSSSPAAIDPRVFDTTLPSSQYEFDDAPAGHGSWLDDDL